MIDTPETVELKYPAEFHFRIICNCDPSLTAMIRVVAEQYSVSQQLAVSNASASGNYQTYSISVVFASRQAMVEFDEQIKALPGVRMLL